ncbi:MAG: hypothetical protein O3B42_05285 [Actinomycetota bacterium]|nr:hypothetical protein [Actinomycetota bacterium]
MNMPVVFVVVLVAGFMTWAILTSRRQSEKKKLAIADLRAQQDELAEFDIHALVAAEVADLRLKEVRGSSGVPDSVLLKLWNQSDAIVGSCPSRDMLKFVVAAGVDPAAAVDGDVTLVCDDIASADSQPATDDEAKDKTRGETAAPAVDQSETDSEPS